jgi:hypothetical protein
MKNKDDYLYRLRQFKQQYSLEYDKGLSINNLMFGSKVKSLNNQSKI